METILVSATTEAISHASQLLIENHVVAFPTETVYGLGARADSSTAVREIFRAKGRPSDNPLIVHIASWEQLKQTVSDWPPLAERLARAFWPGPLTLILPKHPSVSSEASAGLPTIGVRWPDHPVAQQLILKTNLPLAAPSANTSGRPSPTSAQHVYHDLNGKIPYILDGGSCTIGLESTVLDLSQGTPTVLRPGHITVQELSDVCQEQVHTISHGQVIPKSPGQKYKHYSPNIPVKIISKTDDLAFIRSPHSLVLASPAIASSIHATSVTPKNLYALLRDADNQSFSNILIVESQDLVSQPDLWDRITRAARHDTSIATP